MCRVDFFAGALCALFTIAGAAVHADPTFICAGSETSEARAEAAAKLLNNSMEFLSSRGQIHVLVIFAQFKDEATGNDPIPAFAAKLFDPDRLGSFTHFYHTMSFGQLQVQGTVLPKPYTSEQPASAYLTEKTGEVGHYGQFIREILTKVDVDIDLGQFDNDGPDNLPNSGDDDGVVDYLFINVRSTPRGFILGGATGIAGWNSEPDYLARDTSPNGDPVRVGSTPSRGAILQQGSFAQTVGTMAHEFGHGLGLPDLYDHAYATPEEDSAGIGRWGLMGWGAHGWNGDDGPNPFCAWSSEQLGWIGRDNDQLVEIMRDTTELTLADLYQEGVIYKVFLPATVPEEYREAQDYRAAQDYLLLEYRTRKSQYYHRHLPAEGLLIWRVRPYVPTNNQEERKRVDLVCADGLNSQGSDHLDLWAHNAAYLHNNGGNMGDATDPFDGKAYTRLDIHPTPVGQFSKDFSSGAVTGLAINHIRRRGETMIADVALPRWSGIIRETVNWKGEVIVDGDVTIAPEGQLIIHPGTRVLLAGSDRLQAGRDPFRCEIHVQGRLRLQPGRRLMRYTGQGVEVVEPQPIIFASLVPGKAWSGIWAEETADIQMLGKGVVFRDVKHDMPGLSVPALPVQAEATTGILAEPVISSAEPRLLPNYPNPFNPETTIRYILPEQSQVRLVVYDLLGQTVRTLMDGPQSAGTRTVVWDGQNQDRQKVASGLYLYRLEVAGKYSETRQMSLVR